MMESKMVPANTCPVCKKEFSKKSNLTRHLQSNVHDKTPLLKSFKCPLPPCDFIAESKVVILQHYGNSHGFNLEPTNLTFTNTEAFYEWKEKLESSTNAQFVNSKGSKISKTGTLIHYVCHRDGNFVSRSKNLKHLKIQGSNKINAHCPARIDCRITEKCVEVDYVDSHIGHEMDLGRLYITEAEKKEIARKLVAKIPFQEILNDIRDSITNSELKRIHLLTRMDLWNIVHSYHLNHEAILHKNDYLSVDAWVSHMMSSSNTVRFYKPQGIESEKFPHLKSEDFFLIIMNDAQLEILQKYGDNCICIDGTHGLNAYDFQLFTVMVLDDMGQGFPCCFLFSNRSDTLTMETYFKILKDSIGDILKPNTFMSDMDETFYNAWCATMSPVPKRLYCSWHVDRAWRRNLNKIHTREKQVIVYKKLKVLMFETDIYTFNRMCDAFTVDLHTDIDTKDFANYFETYKNTSSTWAYCHRKGAGINTNMNLENMHKVIKHFYFDGKKVKRLDKCIHMLMKFIRDKLFDRLVVMKKGKITEKLKSLRIRHKNSLTQSLVVVRDTEGEDRWSVSSSNNGNIYSITRGNTSCQCQLRCAECKTCIHAFSCSCIDFSIKWNMCKHIHTVCTFLKEGCIDQSNDIEVAQNLTFEEEEEVIITQLSKKQDATAWNKEEEIRKVLNQVINVTNLIENQEQLEVVKKHIAPLEHIIKAMSTKRNIDALKENHPELLEPANKKMKCQPRFASTKSTRKCEKRLSNPSETERQELGLEMIWSKQ